MTERYVQKVDVELRKGARRDQILGIVLELMGLGLIPVAIYVNYWVFAAAAVAFAFGVWLMQKFYSSPKEEVNEDAQLNQGLGENVDASSESAEK